MQSNYSINELSQMPFAPSGYQFYRNVQDFGAKGDGVTDQGDPSGTRCGNGCGSTSTLGAFVFFPPGTYIVTSPIVQYYYTTFIGDPNNKAVIKGSVNFAGIALIDTDPYIPGGAGSQWYINQNQFYRSIRNLVIDLTDMPNKNQDADQSYVPTGIHWQVSQATAIQFVDFIMPLGGGTTAVGLFMENGSGGFVSDLTFYGGNIGMRVGSQQFTARDITFTSCITAISQIWSWSFTWQNIKVYACYIAIDCTEPGGVDGQGVGSITVVDSYFYAVPYAITLSRNGPAVPNIVIDNLLIDGNTLSVVLYSGGETLLPGIDFGDDPLTIRSWAMGKRYTSVSGSGSSIAGFLEAPDKPSSLLDSTGKFFTQSKLQYEGLSASNFIVATEQGISNDGTGDQSGAINTMLANNIGKLIWFPAGVYVVKNTIFVPAGSKIVGEAWPQIMGAGEFFGDESNPQPVVRVGEPGDSGIIEMMDLLFTVQGPTRGAVLVEWNIHEIYQGSAAMWDCHFRIGGATGSDLQFSECPKLSTGVNLECMAASMLLHLTPSSSGYFENLWAWTSDHDLDIPITGNDTLQTQISIYSARGILIESQGPTWFYGSAAEHNTLYQYQLSGASNIFMGMIQTETPYYQPVPAAPDPWLSSLGLFPNDPVFEDCSDSSCSEAWALRVVDSTDIVIYGAGLYSFFSNYDLSCNVIEHGSCQSCGLLLTSV
ncbi:pectate lyase superfamily protein-domain-containing protein [Xylariales sp. PMI_506]|nr:pectate lyase superfamily protein-domain-containing protein [Xylariales sp. PMI_506]